MGDLYGISDAIMHANSLHGQMALHEQLARENYDLAVGRFNDAITKQKQEDSQTNEVKDAEDLPDLNSAYQAGRGIYGGIRGGLTGGAEAYNLLKDARAGLSPAVAITGAAARDATGGLSDVAQSAFLAQSSFGTAARDGGSVLSGLGRAALGTGAQRAQALVGNITGALGTDAQRAQALVGNITGALGTASYVRQAQGLPEAATGFVGRATEAVQSAGQAVARAGQVAGQAVETGATVAQGALSGAKAGISAVGGAGAGWGGELSGLEGIVQKTITRAGGGADLGFVAGKAAGAAGGLMTAGEQLDSLIETGGKSAFTRVTSTGQRVAMSGIDKASEFLNEAGAAADLVAASTGGLLVPLAAAINLAGAVTGIIGGYQDEKADDKAIGLNADGTTDATKAPKLAAQPISEAFTGLGFVGNMSHNAMEHIS